MNLDIKSVELFIRVATLGAIGKAGAEFGYSATTASQRIQALETALGSKLLIRTTRTVTLSVDGELFLEHAKKIKSSIDDAITDLQGANQLVKGELRVTASASFGRRYIAPFIGEFLQKHPDVSIHLELSDGIFDIVQHGYDLAIRIGTLAPSSLMARKISASPRMLVASPVYLEKHGIPSSPKDLIHHNCIALGETRLWKFRSLDGIVLDVKVTGSFGTNYGEVITEAALSNVGIAIKSKWDVLNHLENGSLVSVLSDYLIEPEWFIWAVRPPTRVVSAKVRIFTEFIEAKLNQVFELDK